MKSYYPFKVFIIAFLFLAAVVFIVTGLIVALLWLAWNGSWSGICAVVISYYLGVISRAIR